MDQKYLVAIQIGSTCVKGAVATISSAADSSLSVVNVVEEPIHDSVIYGIVQNVRDVEGAVTNVINRIDERLKNRRVAHVYVGVDGRTFRAQPKTIEQNYFEEEEITARLIEEIRNSVTDSENPQDQVIDVLAKSFVVDNVETANPVGSFGSYVKANLTQLVCSNKLISNLERVIPKSVTITKYIAQQTAIADVVLTDEEKQIGCMLVDLGSQTTAVSIYKKGVLQYLRTIPMGSRNITRDIARVFNVLEEKAEAYKINPDSAPTTIDHKRLIDCINARSLEIVANIVAQLKFAGYTHNDIPAGLVLVGQGAKLDATTEYFRKRQLRFRFGLLNSSIKVVNPSIDISSSIDVISILYDAAKIGIESTAMEETPAVQGEINFDEKETENNEDEPQGPARTTERQHGPKWGVFKNIRNLMERVERFSTQDDEPEDDNE